MSTVNAIRNSDGIWINSQCFREEALAFKKNGYYCPDPTGSLGWYEYWQEQERRCVEGYSVGGVKITGHHYFYLNFSQIQMTVDKNIDTELSSTIKRTKGKKKASFPDFWDGDYNYFWTLEIADKGCTKEQLRDLNLLVNIDENYLTGGYNLVVLKARRKGFQQPYSEPIITPNGVTTMGDIKVGDLVSTPNGSAKVLEKYEQGVCDVYEIILQDGRKVRCGKDHLWKTNYNVIDTSYIIQLLKANKSVYIPSYKEKTNKNVDKIKKVEKLDYQEESACILIDSDDHLYLTTDFIVTHNSYKNAAICANIYNTIPDSLVIISAFEKKYLYPNGTMQMTSNALEFLNTNTGWSKAREFVNRPEHRKASYKEMVDGISIERGYKSQIMAITFKDNPDAARGKDAQLMLYEEAGAFPNLLASYKATKDAMEDGAITTGQSVIFGTSGDLEYGTVDFSEMFMNPIQYDCLPFYNVWDEEADKTVCGYFHPDNLNLVGFYDKEGNSQLKKAKDYELSKREQLKQHSTSAGVINARKMEHPLCPTEALAITNINDFPVIELQRRLSIVKRDNLHLKKGQVGELYRSEDNKVKFKIDLEGKLKPLWSHKIKDNNITGAVVIYEYPVPNAPKGLYKIGHDPYRQDQAADSPSIGSTYVYKSHLQGSSTKNIIVATYHGRPNTSDDYNRNLVMLAELYNTEVGYENEVTEVKSYFEKKKKLQYLALQPDDVISKNIKNSKVNRVYGIHMPEKLKDAAEKYTKTWLLTERDFDEEGNAILNLDTIYDIGLLEELIKYNRKNGNYDRVSAFFILMMYLEDESENKKWKIKDEKSKSKWSNFSKNLFNRS